MKQKLVLLLLVGTALFSSCQQVSTDESNSEELALNNGKNGADPSYNPEENKFFYTPDVRNGKSIMTVYFEYTRLYDSAAVARFNGIENVYKAHLIQFADEHRRDYELVGTELRTTSKGIVIGHDTYWRRVSSESDGKPIKVTAGAPHSLGPDSYSTAYVQGHH